MREHDDLLPAGGSQRRQHPLLEMWLVRLPVDAGDSVPREQARALLDPEEIRRHAALRQQADRDQFAAAHAGLRLLLGRHLGRHPASVTFGSAPCPLCGQAHGRPVVRAASPDLHFSMSRRPGIAAYVVASQPVGIDIEALDRPVGLDDLLPTLHPSERTALAALPARARRTAALRSWVRKEAYLKGIGTGLGIDPSEVEVGVDDLPRPKRGPDGWLLVDLPVTTGHVAALAVAS